MACSNCSVIISNIQGTPTNYKVRFITGSQDVTVDGTQVNPIFENISKSDINNGLEIYVGGPNDGTAYAQFWNGNDITIRFENYFNSECYRDFTVTCVPEVASTTTAAADCCLETQWKLATHGFFVVGHDRTANVPYDSSPLYGVTTTGFAPGIPPNAYIQTLNPSGEAIDSESFGSTYSGGRLCFDPIEPDPDVTITPVSWNIRLRNGTTFVDAYGDSTGATQSTLVGYNIIPAGGIGGIQMTRAFAVPTDNKVTYVDPNGNCYTGNLLSSGGLTTLQLTA